MIALGEIHSGDQVLLSDQRGNKAHGIANVDQRSQTIWIRAFGQRIEFASHNAAGWHRLSQIDVLWHQPEMISRDGAIFEDSSGA
jgi:hypothetical protein